MIVRSPRHSDGTEPMCFFPVHPIKTYVSPWPVPEVQNPCQDQIWTCHLLQMYRVRGLFFSPKEKIRFSKMGWESAHLRPCVFPQSHSPSADSASWGKRKRGSFPKAAHFQGLLPCVLWSDTFRELQTVQRWQQEEAEAGDRAQVPRTPHAGDQGRNERTGKVERLKDNQRGLSVVIYNRDCKMVN